jgi:hypothetical protein
MSLLGKCKSRASPGPQALSAPGTRTRCLRSLRPTLVAARPDKITGISRPFCQNHRHKRVPRATHIAAVSHGPPPQSFFDRGCRQPGTCRRGADRGTLIR